VIRDDSHWHQTRDHTWTRACQPPTWPWAAPQVASPRYATSGAQVQSCAHGEHVGPAHLRQRSRCLGNAFRRCAFLGRRRVRIHSLARWYDHLLAYCYEWRLNKLLVFMPFVKIGFVNLDFPFNIKLRNAPRLIMGTAVKRGNTRSCLGRT